MTSTRTHLAATYLRHALAATLAIFFFAHPAFALLPTDPPPSPSLPDAPLPDAPRPEDPLPEAPIPAPQPAALQITILDGEGALNNIRQRTAREPIVQVEDENHKPVAGALVFFTIHSGSGGASATFDGAATLSVHTDAFGRATTHGLEPNTTRGQFTIAVLAQVGTVVATAVIHQGNSTSSSSSGQQSGQTAAASAPVHHGIVKWVLIGSGVAAGGIVLGILLTRQSGTSISVGTGGVGPP